MKRIDISQLLSTKTKKYMNAVGFSLENIDLECAKEMTIMAGSSLEVFERRAAALGITLFCKTPGCGRRLGDSTHKGSPASVVLKNGLCQFCRASHTRNSH